MTTVSRFSLASELLCFSRFDEGEYILLKPGSHEIARVNYIARTFRMIISRIDRVNRLMLDLRRHDFAPRDPPCA